MSDGSIKIDVSLETQDFVKEINNIGTTAKTGMQKLEEAVKSNIAVIDKLESEQKELTQAIQQAKAALEEQAKATAESESEQKKLAQEYENQATHLANLEAELIRTNQSLKDHKQQLETATSEWVKFKTRMADVSKTAYAIEENMNSIGKSFAVLGGALSLGITAPLKKLGESVLEVGMEFEASLSGIKAVTGATADEMALFKEAALQAGEDTKYSAVEASNAIEELAKAGLTTAQILDGGLNGALILAAAGEIEVADAAEIAATVLNAFKDDALSVGEAANILAGAANASATDVGELKYGLSQVSSVASGMGMSFTDTSTALALFAQNGLKGSDAGTALKTMLTKLQPSTDKQIAQFDELGLLTEEGTSKFYDMNGSMRSLEEIAGLLQASMINLTEAERSAALEIMFGSDAIRAGNILFKEGAEGASNMAAAILKIQAADVAAERMNNLKGRVEELSGKFETFKIKLFETSEGALSAIVEKATELVMWLLNLDDQTLQTIVTIGAIAAATGPVILALGGMISSIGSIAGAVGAVTEAVSIMGVANASASAGVKMLSQVFTKLFSPTTLIIGAIVAVTAAIAEFTPIGDKAYAVLVGLAAGFVALQIITSIKEAVVGFTAVIKGVTLATDASKVSIIAYNVALKAKAAMMGIVTAAQWLWNNAIMANPIGAAVAAVAALAAGIWYLTSKMNKQSEETKRLSEESDELIEKQKSLTDEVKSSNKAYDDSTVKLKAQSAELENLKEKTINLAAEESKSEGQKYLLQARIEELNSSLSDLNVIYDENTGYLKLASETTEGSIETQERAIEAINKSVEAKEREMELDAQKAEQSRLIQDRIRLELELAAAQEKRDEIVEKLNGTEKLSRSEKKELNEKVKELKASEEAYMETITDVKDKEEILNASIEKNTEEIQRNKEAQYESEVAMNNTAKAMEEQEAAANELTKKYEDLADKVQNAFKALSNETELTFEEMQKNQATNIEVATQWGEDLAHIAEVAGEDFRRYLEEMGVDAAGEVRVLAERTDEELEAYAETWRNAREVAYDAFTQSIGAEEFEEAGAAMPQSVSAGIESSDDVKKAAIEQIVQAREAMVSEVRNSNFQSVGEDIGSGVITGLKSKTREVEKAAAELGAAAERGVRERTETHSPSEVMKEVAHDMADGLIIGSEEKEEEVAESGDALAMAYVEGLATGFESNLSEAAVIMLGEWTDVNQGMTDIIKSSGADMLQAEIDKYDALIAETEKQNAELAKAQELASKEKAVAQAKYDREHLDLTDKTAEERAKIIADADDKIIKANEDLNKTIAKNELEAAKERRAQLIQERQDIIDAYQELNDAIVAALKEKYSQEKQLALDDLDSYYNERKTASKAIIDTYEAEYKALKDLLKDEKETKIANEKETYELARDAAKAKMELDEEEYNNRIDFLKDEKEFRTETLKEEVEQRKENSKALLEMYEDEYDARMKALENEKEQSVEGAKESYEFTKDAIKKRMELDEEEYGSRVKFLEKEKELKTETLEKEVEERKEASQAIIEQYELEYEEKIKTLESAEEKVLESIKSVYEVSKAETAKRMELDEEEYDRKIELLESERELRSEAVKEEVEQRKEASKAIIEQYEREYAARMKALDIEESDEVKAIQAQIDAIDAQTEAEERALKEQANLKKIYDLEQKLAQSKTDEERLEAQEKLNEELTKQAREALLQQRKEEKESLKEQINQVKENYDQQREAAKEDLEQRKSEYEQREKEVQEYYDAELKIINDYYEQQKELADKDIEQKRSVYKQQEEDLKEAHDAALKAVSEKYNAEKELAQADLKRRRDEYDQREKDTKKYHETELEKIKDYYEQQKELADSDIAEKRKVYKQQEEDLKKTHEAVLKDIENRYKREKELAKEDLDRRKDEYDQREKDTKKYYDAELKTINDYYKQQKDFADDDIEYMRKVYKQKEDDAKKTHNNILDDIDDFYEKENDKADNDIKTKRDQYKEREDDLKTFLENERTKIDEHYDALMDEDRTQAEARLLMVEGNQQEIIDLLNEYTPDWKTAGQKAGEALLNGLQGITPSIESEVSRIMSLVNQAEQMKANLEANQASYSHLAVPQPSSEIPPVQDIAQMQQQQPIYVVQPNDTLSGIAAKYGITVTSLRSENHLDPANDRFLPIGTVLRIPILHEGGISLKEQIALIDKNEAVAPLATLAKMMEQAVISTTSRLAARFSHSSQNTSNTVTNNNDHGIQLTVNYSGGEMSSYDVNKISRELGAVTAREMRGRGILFAGG